MTSISECGDGEAGEGGFVEGGVESEEAMTVAEGVGADEEIGEDAAGSGAALFSATGGVGLKCTACGAPDCFVHLPFDGYAGLAEEGIEEGFGSGRKGEEFGIDGSGDDELSAIPGGIQGRLRRGIQGFVGVPEGDEDIAVESGGHFDSIILRGSFTTKLANVADDGFASRGDSRIANTTKFFKRAFGAYRLNAEFRADLLEEKFVAGVNAQGAADFMRHGDLALAGDASLFLQG
jgi:hypothetical protein